MIRKLLLVILLVAPPIATAVVSRLNAFPRRFAEVAPGAIYRGGRPTPAHIQRLREEKNIRTIVSLIEDKNTPADQARARAAHEANIRLMRVPMPGDGVADFALLDHAADAVNLRENQPVFFHCAAGKQRSNAVLAAYRLRHCGWTLEQVLAELEEKYGLERETSERTLVEHLTRYANWVNADSNRQLSRSTGPTGVGLNSDSPK